MRCINELCNAEMETSRSWDQVDRICPKCGAGEVSGPGLGEVLQGIAYTALGASTFLFIMLYAYVAISK